jgi:hypothetical protein
MLLFVENKRIFAGLSVSRWGWLLHNAGNFWLVMGKWP